MRTTYGFLMVAVLLTVRTGLAMGASPGDGLSPQAAQQHCDECHAIDELRIGPPFRAVASRYALEGDVAVERLARKIINGGAGNWGSIPMVPNERVSLDDARAIARWILSLRPTV
jgi:cytochrome c